MSASQKSEVRFAVYPVGVVPSRENLIGFARRVSAGYWVCGESLEDLPEFGEVLAACKWMLAERGRPESLELDSGLIIRRVPVV